MSLVRATTTDHDRATDAPDRLTVPEPWLASSVMQAALERLRLEGAVFLRAEYREPWAYQSFAASDTAKILRPGAERVICSTSWPVAPAGSPSTVVTEHWVIGGDVIVLPYGDQHCMGGVHDAETVSMASILPMPPWSELPVIRHGADGEQTDVVCGYLHSQDPLFDPALLVSRRVRRTPTARSRRRVGSCERRLCARSKQRLARRPGWSGCRRPPELLLVEALRLAFCSSSAPAVEQGWLAALDDPAPRPVLALLHGAPARRWTVTGLARVAAVSRSVLDARFRESLRPTADPLPDGMANALGGGFARDD